MGVNWSNLLLRLRLLHQPPRLPSETCGIALDPRPHRAAGDGNRTLCACPASSPFRAAGVASYVKSQGKWVKHPGMYAPGAMKPGILMPDGTVNYGAYSAGTTFGAHTPPPINVDHDWARL